AGVGALLVPLHQEGRQDPRLSRRVGVDVHFAERVNHTFELGHTYFSDDWLTRRAGGVSPLRMRLLNLRGLTPPARQDFKLSDPAGCAALRLPGRNGPNRRAARTPGTPAVPCPSNPEPPVPSDRGSSHGRRRGRSYPRPRRRSPGGRASPPRACGPKGPPTFPCPGRPAPP